ncbi:MAG: flagellar basal body rod protein FlgC [Burkholderiales bacterium]|nr:flagellar basal body rod protein FlgC [Burkholderiales bacterium]
MALDRAFDIAASALTAQSQRLNVVASNLANADSATGADGQPYKARQVVFAATPLAREGAVGVRVAAVVDDPSPARRVYDPKHPLADAEGYVTPANVNVVEEMVNMISASRAYQNNIEVMNTAKTLMARTLRLGE